MKPVTSTVDNGLFLCYLKIAIRTAATAVTAAPVSVTTPDTVVTSPPATHTAIVPIATAHSPEIVTIFFVLSDIAMDHLLSLKYEERRQL